MYANKRLSTQKENASPTLKTLYVNTLKEMEKYRAQGSVEWLMGHAWSIVVVLTVASVLAYIGIFEGFARPRFEGLNAAGVQSMADQVHLYSDGIMVFMVMNKRPYSHTL